MNNFALFTDVSLNPQLKCGIGGYLLVPAALLDGPPHAIELDEVSARLVTRRFTETSSTRLELQTVLWALENSWQELIIPAPGNLQIYTDSQSVAGLLPRRDGLLKSDFIAKRSGRLLINAPLYRQFYEAYDRFGFQVNKVRGHSPASSHDTVRRIFSCVDRGVRKALDLWLDSTAAPHNNCRSAPEPSA